MTAPRPEPLASGDLKSGRTDVSEHNFCVGCPHCLCDPTQPYDSCEVCEDCDDCTCWPGLIDSDCPEHGGFL